MDDIDRLRSAVPGRVWCKRLNVSHPCLVAAVVRPLIGMIEFAVFAADAVVVIAGASFIVVYIAGFAEFAKVEQ